MSGARMRRQPNGSADAAMRLAERHAARLTRFGGPPPVLKRTPGGSVRAVWTHLDTTLEVGVSPAGRSYVYMERAGQAVVDHDGGPDTLGAEDRAAVRRFLAAMPGAVRRGGRERPDKATPRNPGRGAAGGTRPRGPRASPVRRNGARGS